jgi:hypothetical protein
MPLNNALPVGWQHVENYRMPGLPWVLTAASTTPGAPDRIIFHKITKSLTVRNTSTTAGDQIGVGFTPAGVTGSNYYVIPGGQAHTFDIRVAELYIDAKSGTPGYSISADLTLIDASEDFYLSGSFWPGVE